MLPKSWYFIFNNWTPVKQNRTDESVVAHLKTNWNYFMRQSILNHVLATLQRVRLLKTSVRIRLMFF